MSFLYKDKKDIKYSVEINPYPNGKVNMLFTCNSGKFGTVEILAEYNITTKILLEVLQNHFDDNK